MAVASVPLDSPVYWVQLPKIVGFPSRRGIKWPVFLCPPNQEVVDEVVLLIECDKTQ